MGLCYQAWFQWVCWLLKITFIHLFISSLCVYAYSHGGQRTTRENQFSPSTLWPRSSNSGHQESPLPAEPPCHRNGFNLLPSGTFLKCPSSLYLDVKWYYGLNVSPKISWLGNVVSSTAMLGDLIC